MKPISCPPSAGHRPARCRRPGRPATLLAAVLLASTATAALAAPGGWTPGRILVVPQAGLDPSGLDAVVAPHGGKARKVGQSDLYIVEVAHGSEKSVARQLSAHRHLKFAEVDRPLKLTFVANDPYLGSEWHLAKIGAPAAWDAVQGAGVTIAVIDTGVNGSHPDLAARLVPGWNFYDNTADTADVNGHGTAVAGTAAASTDNGIGVASVAGRARLMPVRVADSTGTAYISTIAQAITWAADNGARVANVSFGAAGSAAVQNAAQYMKGKGGLVFVSAGNNGVDEQFAPTTSLIAVSATDSADLLAGWSSYGGFVSLAAPGADIYTTTRSGGYGAWSGTSFSSPVAAGVAALVMAARPALDASQVESLLFAQAVDRGAPGRDPYYGWGRVNAAASVQAAVGAVPADTQAPTVSIASPAANATVGGVVNVAVNASDDVGVTRVELTVNGSGVAIDSAAPFGFAWDSRGVANGMNRLVATAYDAAGNSTASAPVSVNVANAAPPTAADVTRPTVTIVNPVAGRVAGMVTVSTSASDDSGTAGITQSIHIDGKLKASGTGATLAYAWNSNKAGAGTHLIEATARDKAGNSSTVSVQVVR